MPLTSKLAFATALLAAGAAHTQAAAPATAEPSPAFRGVPTLLARQTHAAVEVVTLGDDAERAYVLLPAEPALAPGPVPVVFFHHGWQGMNPRNYGALLDHLEREGNVVVFPTYQHDDATSPQLVVGHAAAAERAALAALATRGYTPDAARAVDFGYSMGAAISLQLAATAAAERLPPPGALVLAAPGDAYHVARGADARSIWPDLHALPATLPIAIVTGADDHAIGYPTARKLAAGLCRVPAAPGPARRVLLVLPSGEHAGVKVAAGHASPGAPDARFDWDLSLPADRVPHQLAGRDGFEPSASLNQLDFYGYWRVLDAVLDSLAEHASTDPAYRPPASVFRTGTPGQLYLGTWADGTPYPPAHTEDLCGAK